MTPLQLECITAMREGWRLSPELILRPPHTVMEANKSIHRQTVNALHRRGLIEKVIRSDYWVLTEDGKTGALIK